MQKPKWHRYEICSSISIGIIRTIDIALNVLSRKQYSSFICQDCKYLNPKNLSNQCIILFCTRAWDARAWQGGIFGISAIFLSEEECSARICEGTQQPVMRRRSPIQPKSPQSPQSPDSATFLGFSVKFQIQVQRQLFGKNSQIIP